MKGGESVSMRARVYTCSLRADTRVCRMWWGGGRGEGERPRGGLWVGRRAAEARQSGRGVCV